MAFKFLCSCFVLYLCLSYPSTCCGTGQSSRSWIQRLFASKKHSPRFLDKPRKFSEKTQVQFKSRYDAADNRDPAKADPYGKITCIGPLPPVAWPETLSTGNGRHYSPGSFTLQQLCAKPQYGGASRGHLGGYCDDQVSAHGSRADFASYDRRTTEPVVFDISLSSGASTYLDHLRLRAFCLQHCYCTYAKDNAPPKYKEYRLSSLDSDVPPPPRNQNNPDVDVLSQEEQPLDYPGGPVAVIGVPFQKQFRALSGRDSYHWRHLFLGESNRIVCKGSLPWFDLPGPFRRRNFRNIQELCANALDGGSRHANAGAYCRVEESVVDFTYELIPSLFFIAERDLPGHPDEYADRRSALAVREFCLPRCKCKMVASPTPTPPSKTTPTPDIENERLVVTGRTAKMVMVVTENGIAVTRTYQLTGEETGKCSAPPDSGSEQCQELLPEQFLPQAPSAKATTPPGVDSVTSYSQCGKQCSSYADCQSESKDGECHCIANPDPLFIKQLGADPIATFALCLFTSDLVRRPSMVKLGGRSVSNSYSDEHNVRCPCNQTYVSRACCNSKSGILWEPPSLKLS